MTYTDAKPNSNPNPYLSPTPKEKQNCYPEARGAFHQAFCQCFSLTNLLSANQMQGFQ